MYCSVLTKKNYIIIKINEVFIKMELFTFAVAGVVHFPFLPMKISTVVP